MRSGSEERPRLETANGDGTCIEVGRAVRSGPDAFAAAADAAADAVRQLRLHAPTALLVFASPVHGADEVVRGARSVAGVPVLGASSAGEILDGEHEGSVVVAALASPHLCVRMAAGRAVSDGWRAAVDEALDDPRLRSYFDGSPAPWTELTRRGRAAFALLLSPGSTRRAPSMTYEILEAVKRRSLGRLPIFGGASASDAGAEANHVFAGDRALRDGLAVALFETELQFGIALSHGLRPTERRCTVTAARGHEVLEIDGRPAAEAYADLLGVPRGSLDGTHVATATGRVVGLADPIGQYMPDVAGYVTPAGGINFTIPVSPGTVLTLLEASGDSAANAGRDALRKAKLRGGIAEPAVAIVTRCSLRPKVLGGAVRDEVGRLVETLGGAPLVGFQSMGEEGLSDEGVPRHTNMVSSILVLGKDLSQVARVARENERLLRRSQADLEQLVAERTAQLTAANLNLAAEVAERRRAEASERRQARALRTLSACNAALVRAADEQALLESVCRLVVEVGGYQVAWVGTPQHDEARSVRPVAQAGADDGLIAMLDLTWADRERGRGPTGMALRTGRPAVVRDITTDPLFAPWRAEVARRGFSSVASFPLLVDGRPIAALTLDAEVDAFDDDELKLLAELADDVAFGIAALRTRAERAALTTKLVQADRLAVTGTLAAGVAHEINNPLAYTMAALEFLEQELRELAPDVGAGRLEEAMQAIAEAREGAVRVKHVVRDLKTFSRVDDETTARVELRRVIESSINMAWNEIRHRARMVKDYARTPPVTANESRLGQVFLNLLVNAAQAIPEGRADANEIRVATRTDGAGRAVVEVRDTGAGIPADVAAHIFDPFFTTKPVGIGTGLGLSICRNLVSALGGDIAVESRVGEGSTFRVTLPAAVPTVEDRAARSPPGPAPSGRSGRVLVVDDDASLAAGLRRALRRHHEVLVATDAAEVRDRIAGGERFDAILCDLMMPSMTGMELHAAVARIAPDQAGRMVFMTGGAFTASARQFLAEVPNPRLEKPFDAANLLAVLRGVVR